MVEILVKVKFQQTLHPGTHRHSEGFVACLKGDSLTHLDERHILQLFDQLIRFADANAFEYLSLLLLL